MQKLYVVVSSTPLFTKPSTSSTKHCDLYGGSIVMYDGDYFSDSNSDNYWGEIIYRTNTRELRGWIPLYYIEPYSNSLFGYDVIRIKNATRSDDDFAQNLIYKNNVQFNLCGEFSVLFCARWYEFDIEDWLDEWAIKSPSYFNRIFYGGKSKTTGLGDLANMLHTFEGYPEKFTLAADVFTYGKRVIFTPYKLMNVLRKDRIIIGCKIDSRFGRLADKGIPHWVVLEKMTPEARGGLCNLYNPASNSVETYNFDRLISSTGTVPYGLIVPR